MYTGIVKLRAFTLVLTLCVAAAPALALVCELDCDAPKTATESCHKPAVAHDAFSVRDGARECRTQHGSSEAAMTNVGSRDFSFTRVATFDLLDTSTVGAIDSTPVAVHGPPGMTARTPTSLNTVLRI